MREILDITLSNGSHEHIPAAQFNDDYTQVALWRLIDEELRRRNPEHDAAIVCVTCAIY